MDKARFEDVVLTNASIEDYDFYYDLKSESSNVYYLGHNKEPDYSNFGNRYVENVIE